MYIPPLSLPCLPDTNLEWNGPGVVRDPEELHYVERILRHVVRDGADIVKTLKRCRKESYLYVGSSFKKGCFLKKNIYILYIYTYIIYNAFIN